MFFLFFIIKFNSLRKRKFNMYHIVIGMISYIFLFFYNTCILHLTCHMAFYTYIHNWSLQPFSQNYWLSFLWLSIAKLFIFLLQHKRYSLHFFSHNPTRHVFYIWHVIWLSTHTSIICHYNPSVRIIDLVSYGFLLQNYLFSCYNIKVILSTVFLTIQHNSLTE